MIRETTYHATQAEADAHGKAFKESWGWAYSPSYSVGHIVELNQDGPIDKWACYTYRHDSCD